MNKERPYKPINCSFYDELEAAAVTQKIIKIKYLDELDRQQTLKTQIKDLISRKGIEYMLLENHTLLRLDMLLSIDGKKIDSYC